MARQNIARHLAVGLLVIALAMAGVVVSRDRWWPWLSDIKQELTLALPGHRESLEYINTQILKSPAESTFKRIVQVRQWINGNSIHLIDAEHDTYAFHVPTVLDKLRQFNANGGKPPHLSCGPRAYAMKEVLDTLGIESRIIDLFVIRGGSVESHTLIDVYDGERKRWTLQDPDFNVSYVHAVNREPLSAREAVQLGKRWIAYESDGGRIENPANLDGTVATLFDLGVLHRYSYVGRRSQFLYSPALDVDRTLVWQDDVWVSFRRYLQARDFSPDFMPVGVPGDGETR